MTRTMLANIVLIDDNSADNYLHRLVLEDMGIAKQIHSFIYAEQALAFLAEAEPGTIDLIFLDINMPRMDGFEFLDAYSLLDPAHQAEVAIVMLSTTLNPDDRDRALSHDAVTTFINKPLSESLVEKLLEQYF